MRSCGSDFDVWSRRTSVKREPETGGFKLFSTERWGDIGSPDAGESIR